MKKIYNILLAAFVLMSVSCVNDIEKVFDTSASDRMNDRLLECKGLLTGSEHGWMIHYYPSKDRSMGGCTYAAKFEESGDVKVTSDVVVRTGGEFGDVVESHYSMKLSTSVVLSFDTYNDFIHYWSDPDIVNSNTAMDGDFEFAYVRGDENQMVFRGGKTGNMIVFTPLEEDIVSTAKKIGQVYEELEGPPLYAGYNFRNEAGNSVKVEKVRGYNGFSMEGYNMPYVITPTGVNFYEPVTVGGVTLQNLFWNGSKFISSDAVAADGTAADITLEGYLHERYQDYDTFLGTYTFGYEAYDLWYGNSKWVDATVRIVEDVYNESFYLEGLKWEAITAYDGYQDPGQPFRLRLEYDPYDGSIIIPFQAIGKTGANKDLELSLCMSVRRTFTFHAYASAHFRLMHNNDVNNLELAFNFDDSPELDAFILMYLGANIVYWSLFDFTPLKKID